MFDSIKVIISFIAVSVFIAVIVFAVKRGQAGFTGSQRYEGFAGGPTYDPASIAAIVLSSVVLAGFVLMFIMVRRG